MRSIRVGVIGLGVGEQHAAAYAADPRCELVALADLDESRLAGAGSRFPGARLTRDATELLEDETVDAVSIASYDDAHAAQVVTAVGRGKHVFVEKPLCTRPSELAEIKAAWESGGQPALASNLVLRAAPLYRRLHELAHGGELGRLYAFDGDYLYGRLHKVTDGWRGEIPGYSVMLGGGVHLVDLMLWITGERPVEVSAVGNRISTEGTGFSSPDFVAATYRFESGLAGRITANFGSVQPHQHVVRAFGTAGAFAYDDRGARLHVSRDPADAPQLLGEAPQPAGKGALIPHFVNTIVEDWARPETAQREFDTISVCLAADRALDEGETVKVEYV